jgi:GDPmannose 4,6-dehydratase
MPEAKTALICGISGQDGTYLAKYLLSKDYVVWGTSRDVDGTPFQGLKALGIFDRVKLTSMVVEDFRSVLKAVKQCAPTEIYFLAGQSSVGLSFEEPAETIQSIAIGTLNILEVCRMSDYEIRLYQAGSSECFGDTEGLPANEKTPFCPRSPYAVAKTSAYWLVSNYREAYNLYACTGILFNHDSPLRPIRFVTQKIISAAKNIANGTTDKLILGRLDIARDWGWAPEYVEAMWLMLQQEKPDDFVIGTGESFLLEDFVRLSFLELGLDWRDHVEQSQSFLRPTDLLFSCADTSKAKHQLGWVAKIHLPEVVKRMISSDS